MIDLHTHYDRCGHAEGSLADVAGWASERGIAVLVVSDHAPRFADRVDHPLPDTRMARSQWDGYLAEASELRVALRGRLDLRVGVEADWLPGSEAVYRAELARPALDYVIGSVHEVAHAGSAWRLFHPESFAGVDLDELHRGYWRSVASAAGSGLFDVLGHLDLVRMLPVPPAPPSPVRDRGGDQRSGHAPRRAPVPRRTAARGAGVPWRAAHVRLGRAPACPAGIGVGRGTPTPDRALRPSARDLPRPRTQLVGFLRTRSHLPGA